MINFFDDVIRPEMLRTGATGDDVIKFREKYEKLAYDHGLLFQLDSLMREVYNLASQQSNR